MQQPTSYQAVIGLEVHCQLATRSKIFCSCPNQYGEAPNRLTCPVCLGLPGALPALNLQAVEYAVMAALALSCEVQEHSVFARKHYFYPDLPKGYQITQYDQPYALGGYLDIELASGTRRIPLTRIHMEEDAGKSLHGDHGSSLIDLNRAGVPLIEIVGTPTLHSSEEAVAWLKALHAVLTSLGVTDGNMERGNFRCDANVSVRPQGSQTLGTRVELKNLNSFRYVGRALDYEIARQIDALEGGEVVRQQTRLWDQATNRTVVMREKEDAQDYRYVPEPDLRPLTLKPEYIESIRARLPELPAARALRFQQTLGIPAADARVLTSSLELARLFEETVQLSQQPRASANWITGEVLGLLNREGLELSQLPVTATHLASLLSLVEQGVLSGRMAREVFEDLARTGETPEAIVARRGLKQVSDTGAIEAVVDALLAANPAEVSSYRSGKEKVFGFFVGQAMKALKGQANPAVVNDLLRQKLKGG